MVRRPARRLAIVRRRADGSKRRSAHGRSEAGHRGAARGAAGVPAAGGVPRARPRLRRVAVRRGRGRPRRLLDVARAREITWYREPTEGLDDSNPPFYKWFADGELNASVNCLDRHLAAGGGDKTAYIWVGEPGDERVITYRELHDEVNRLANVLRDLGVRKGDRVAIYLGMVPELPIALLACARIGAAHSVVFGGFSAQSLAGRINDAECKVLITADGGWRKGGIVPLKQAADEAVERLPVDRARARRAPHRARGRLDRGPRRLVPRPRAGRRRLVRARAHERRGHAVPALHVRHDREAEGHPAHDAPATCSAPR